MDFSSPEGLLLLKLESNNSWLTGQGLNRGRVGAVAMAGCFFVKQGRRLSHADEDMDGRFLERRPLAAGSGSEFINPARQLIVTVIPKRIHQHRILQLIDRTRRSL